MAGEKVFDAAGPSEWFTNATVGAPWGDEWAYIFGYREAGDAVVDHALASGLQDALVYPAAFLYRHGLELALKRAIVMAAKLIRLLGEAGELADDGAERAEKAVSGLDRTHSLQRLMNRLSDVMSLVTDEELPEDVSAAIDELHQIDPKGETFRYAYRTGARPGPWIPQPKLVGIARLKTLGTAIDYVTGGVCGWLDHALENTHDYLQILRDNVEPVEPGW